MAEEILRTEKLNVGYGQHVVVNDVEIKAFAGQIQTLIGPNGAGKSTILKTLIRQIAPLSGKVYLRNTDVYTLSEKQIAQQVSVVLTTRPNVELMTCRDIVATGRYPYTGRLGILSAEDESKVEEAMAAVHALDLRNRDFNAISDGQRQRVLLARAICQEPEIIILDEPTSFLDIRHKLQLLSILRDMAKQKGITVIMSLHEIDLAQKISDKVVCVKGDHIARAGEPDKVFDEDTIRDLYEIDQGTFDPVFGSIELPRPVGEPQVLVLSACGTGIPVFRRLQKQGVPFVAGILYTNDIDYRLARVLAMEVIGEKPFIPITDAAFNRALYWLDRCPRVINAGVEIGETNKRVAELIERAKGKL